MTFTAASSKTLCAFIPLLILPYSFNTQALSATTANTIKGNAPELSAALQAEIASGTFSLLNLVATDSSGTATNYQSDTDAAFKAKINSIQNLRDETLDNITAVLANDTTGTLSGEFSALQAGDAIDIDGDSNYSLRGTTTADWYYNNTSGSSVKITTTNKTLCELAAAGQTPYIQIGASNATSDWGFGIRDLLGEPWYTNGQYINNRWAEPPLVVEGQKLMPTAHNKRL